MVPFVAYAFTFIPARVNRAKSYTLVLPKAFILSPTSFKSKVTYYYYKEEGYIKKDYTKVGLKEIELEKKNISISLKFKGV